MKLIVLIILLHSSIASTSEHIDSTRADISLISNNMEVTTSLRENDRWEIELFRTGEWFNSSGTGYSGADESILVHPGTVLGYRCQSNYTVIADDFEVPAGQMWCIDEIVIAGYQTYSGMTPTINGLYLAVYDDPPTTGTMIYGGYTTNIFTSAEWSGIYRVDEAGSGTNTDRPIMAVTAELSYVWNVSEGTYWIGWQFDGTGSYGPWAPPVVVSEIANTGNGLQSVDGGILWEPVSNGGYPQGFPFILYAHVANLEQGTWGSIKTMF
jgi:hypothetical protein